MNVKTIVMALLVSFAAIGGFAGVALADHNGGDSSGDVVYVDAENPDPTADTYGTIQEAVDNASAGFHVNVTAGTYNESVNLTANNLHFVSDGNVTINATDTDSGVAFQNPNDYTYTVADSFTLEEATASGGAGGDAAASLTQTYFGVPLWIYVLVILVAVVIGVRSME